MDTAKVTRVEVIDHSLPFDKAGRVYTKRGDIKVEVVLQDDGKTLKVFIAKKEETT